MIVDVKGQVRFRHPNAPDLDTRRVRQRGKYVDGRVLPVVGLDPIEQTAKMSFELNQILGAAHDVVVRTVGGQGPDRSALAEHGPYAVVRDSGAERQLERHWHTGRSGIFIHAEGNRRLIGLPAPGRWLAIFLVDRDRDDIAEEMTEFDEKRLGRQREHTKLPDLFLLDPLLHFPGKDAPEIVLLYCPVILLMVRIIAPDQFDVDRAPLGGVTIGRHRHEDRPGRYQSIALTNVRCKTDHMCGALRRHSTYDGDSIFMLCLHFKQDAFWMIREIVDVHTLVVLGAQQHEIIQVLRKRRRADYIAARSVRTIGYDVRDEAELAILAASNQVSYQILVTPPVLTAPSGLGPKSNLNFVWDLCFCHGEVPIRFAITFTFYPQSSTAEIENLRAARLLLGGIELDQQNLTRESEEFLEDLAEELSVPPSRYEQAERSYKSLGDWLLRDASSVRQYAPKVYVQGSFRLGTTIRPSNDAEEYDIDAVCEFQKLSKASLTQQHLKVLLGSEIEAYRKAQNMSKPLREGRRCWVLDYADGAQFHMDVVPALPNGQSARIVLETRGLDARWTSTAIAITDNEGATYSTVTDDWPRSNPKGYAEWFKNCMAAALERRKRLLAESTRASVENIPDYKVRTPLQAAVMILKRHRDHSFEGRKDERPISVIITTLAAHSYNGEETIGGALTVILAGMDQHIHRYNGRHWIPNPTDPLENFADKWAEHPQRAAAFVEWLQKARTEFAQAARSNDRALITETVARGVGSPLAERAARRRQPPARPSLLKTASVAPTSAGLSFPDKSRVPTKPQGFGGAE